MGHLGALDEVLFGSRVEGFRVEGLELRVVGLRGLGLRGLGLRGLGFRGLGFRGSFGLQSWCVNKPAIQGSHAGKRSPSLRLFSDPLGKSMYFCNFWVSHVIKTVF